MTDTFALTAHVREASKHSARDTRNEGRVPAIVYGSKLKEAIPVSLDASDILRTYRKAGSAGLVDLDIDGKKHKVLIHVLDLHPVKHVIWHVDFLAVNLKEKTVVSVPLEFVGESPAVKNLGGLLMKDLEQIDIRCFPTDIPQHLTVDISSIENLHEHITVANLNLDPEKFELMGIEPDAVICSVTGHTAEETEETENAEGEATEGEAETKAAESSEEKAE